MELGAICYAVGALELFIQFLAVSWNPVIASEFLAHSRNASQCFAQSRGVARHPAFVPEKETQLAMKRIDRAPAIDREQLFRPRADFAFRFAEFGMIRRRPLANLGREINRQRVRQNK